jgi:hypothetical protein
LGDFNFEVAMSKLWLDDERDPMTYGESFKVPDNATKILLKFGRNGWTWVKTVAEAKKVLEGGNVSILSCDNDLGVKEEGYQLLNWLEEKAATEPDFPIPEHIFVHSHNIDRIAPMQQTIDSIKRFRGK